MGCVLVKFMIRKTSLFFVMITTAICVLSDALDALMRGKDSEAFLLAQAAEPGLLPGDYLALIAISMLAGLLVPVAYAVYQIISLYRRGQSRMARAIWGVLLAGTLALRLLSLDLYSVFSLISGVCIVALFIHHLSMKPADPNPVKTSKERSLH